VAFGWFELDTFYNGIQ